MLGTLNGFAVNRRAVNFGIFRLDMAGTLVQSVTVSGIPSGYLWHKGDVGQRVLFDGRLNALQALSGGIYQNLNLSARLTSVKNLEGKLDQGSLFWGQLLVQLDLSGTLSQESRFQGNLLGDSAGSTGFLTYSALYLQNAPVTEIEEEKALQLIFSVRPALHFASIQVRPD